MLEIKNLHARAGEKEILKGIDLTINDGEIHALMGTNGAGKSTLSNVIVGNPAYEVTEGEIIFNGQNLLEMTADQRANAGIFMSFQAPVEIPGVSMTNFMKAAVNAIDQKLLKRSVNEGFSGGEKKRNEIFQMAMLEPTFCILDETDSGLDVDALRIVATGFNKLRTEETSAIIITHYQRLLDYIQPDVVHVLIDGKIVQTGGPDLALKIENEGFDFIVKNLTDNNEQ